MIQEKADDTLDYVLGELYKRDGFLYSREFHPILMTRVSGTQITPIINKFVNDGYAEKILEVLAPPTKPHKHSPPYYCRLTIHGRLFFERGGYKEETARNKRQKIWTISKILANTINAIIILIIASFTAWLSFMSIEQEDKNKQDITAMKSRLDTFSIKKDTVIIIDKRQ